MRKLIFLFIFILIYKEASAQKLPSQWTIEDGKYLIAGTKDSEGLYDERVVEEMRVYFTQPNFWTLLGQNYNRKIDILASLKYKGVTYQNVGIRFKGQTSYSQTGTSQKKSFNITMDTVDKEQTLLGYKTLNLNNAFQDNSFMREVLYYNLIRRHIHAARANFIRLYINDEDWGIYQNVQQLNKDFLEEWYTSNDGTNMRADRPDGLSNTGTPGGGANWGDGTAGFNYRGSDVNQYNVYYDLKSSDKVNPWSDFIKAAEVLNSASLSNADREKEYPTYLDIDRILWHLACEIAFADDDSYIYKGKMDYFVYQDEKTGRWTSYEYDANSVMYTRNATWSPFYNAEKVNYPLLNRILNVPAFRQRYLAHLRTITDDLLNTNLTNELINRNHDLIKNIVVVDTKRPTTLSSHTTELANLRSFVTQRRNTLLANTEVAIEKPVINDLKYSVNNKVFDKVTKTDKVKCTVFASHSSGIANVFLHYSLGMDSKYTSITMVDNGSNGDDKANDGIFTASIPSHDIGSLIKFYTEVVAKNTAGTRAYLPKGAEHQLMFYTVSTPSVPVKSLVVNEFMASNEILKDEKGEFDDWIELYNNSSNDIDLGGFYLSDDPNNLKKFKFANGSVIKSKGYLIVWADEQGSQGNLHANFKLSASGEVITLLDKNEVMLDSVNFGLQVKNKSFARVPNGTGSFAITDHTFNGNNGGLTNNTLLESEQPLVIFPNPSNGQTFVKNDGDVAKRMRIIDVLGRVIYQSQIDPNSTLSLPDLDQGVYFLNQGSYTQQFIVVK